MLDYFVRQFDLEKGKAVLSLFDKDPSAQLLDCGCGSGSFTLRVGDSIGTRNVYGVEINNKNIINAREKGIQVSSGDLNQRLPYKSESFDCVVANHVIEHLDNTDLFCKEIHRVLKRGGYSVIATPNLAAWYNICYLFLGKQPYVCMVSDETLAGSWVPLRRLAVTGDDGPGHRRMFTLGALTQLLEYHGFSIEKAVGCGFFPVPNPVSKLLSFIDKWHAANVMVKARKKL